MANGKTGRRFGWKVAGGAAIASLAVMGGGAWFLLGPAESAAKTAELPPGPLPVARIVDPNGAKAADWHIVSVFGTEAILATDRELVRVKVGSTLRGIGTVTGIEAGDNGGGTVAGTEATLRTL